MKRSAAGGLPFPHRAGRAQREGYTIRGVRHRPAARAQGRGELPPAQRADEGPRGAPGEDAEQAHAAALSRARALGSGGERRDQGRAVALLPAHGLLPDRGAAALVPDAGEHAVPLSTGQAHEGREDPLHEAERAIVRRGKKRRYTAIATLKEIEARQSKLKAVRDANDPKVRGLPLPAYFKVPFTEALDLVATRRVYIEAGTAYVPFEHVVSILFAAFRANLSKELSGAFRKYNRSIISKDDRLAPVLSNLAKHHIDADYSATPVPGSENAIRPDMIDGLATTSMPLCMRSLHKGLKLNHHLKFAGRQQYGLFLKGIGLQLDDAIAYWKQEFCKKMSVDDFNKKYAYNIRHNYGKEGKRKDYAPSNCMRIITGDPPKNGEYHGCPFRHYEQEHLRKALQGVPEGDKQEILSLAENHHYQIACKKYFEATHPGSDPDVLINHPNGYFEESRRYYAAKEKGVTVTAS
ncbi:hypothetical protein ON010_g7317 [Phytophthora cinnamomi]|nr:hypothetical protein ON010_g7317 [Phytophthora cinnamomi]